MTRMRVLVELLPVGVVSWRWMDGVIRVLMGCDVLHPFYRTVSSLRLCNTRRLMVERPIAPQSKRQSEADALLEGRYLAPGYARPHLASKPSGF